MGSRKVRRVLLGVVLAGVGALANSGAGAKTLNVLWNQASPKPSCAPANYNAKGEAFRLSGGNWVLDCVQEQSIAGQTATNSNCNSADAATIVGVGNDANPALQTWTGMTSSWTQTASIAIYCGNSWIGTGSAWGS